MAAPRDKFGRPIVVVTGMGVVTSLGAGKTDNWAKLTAGESGIRTVTRFPIDGLRSTMAGTVDFVPVEPFSSTGLTERLAELATEEAVEQSGIGSKGNFPGPLFLAVAPVEVEWPQRLELGRLINKQDLDYDDLLRISGGGKYAPYHHRFMFGSVAARLAETFGTKGSPISLSTACASGATAIQLGVEAIRRGETDAALCVGADATVNPEAMVRFSLLSALSTHNDPPQAASRPFSKNRDGFVMAEGAGTLVLESYDAAVARGATILGVLAGCGELTDSFHRTRSSPDGKPIIGCVKKTLADAGMTPDQIDHINAHGTATPENDKMEYLGISAVFGERAKQIPVSSNKSMVGHTISAAGTVEAVFSLLTLEHQRIPPTINYDNPDPAILFDVVGNKARDATVTAVMSNSFGFGAEFAHLDHIWEHDPASPEESRIEIPPRTHELFAQLRLDGKPALIFAAHLGNWELPALAAVAHGLDAAILYRRPNIASADRIIQDMRAVKMGTLIPAGRDAPRKLAEALQNGQHVAMLVDQYLTNGVEVTFFGRKTKANPMLARLRRQVECPIHGTRIIRLPNNRFRAELSEEVPAVRDASGQIDVA